MLNKYLNSDPIPWLTDGENPAVTYLAKRDLIENSERQLIYDELSRSPLTGYFNENFSDGVLGDYKHPDLFYRGSVWFFLLAVESGYNNSTEFISSTADKLCSRLQLGNGGFRFSYENSCAVGCRTGNMVYSLLKCGISDHRTKNGIEWIMNNQRHDGGWLHCPVAGFCDVMKLVFFNRPGGGLKHETSGKIPSCPVASYTCLRALIEACNAPLDDTIMKGAGFFSNNNLFYSSSRKIFCGTGTDFKKPGYPVMSQYDYLSGMILLSAIKNTKYKTVPFFNSIIKMQNVDGRWKCENNSRGMIREKGISSRWVTLNVLKLMKLIADEENQL